MNTTTLLAACSILLTAIMGIATSSIAVECYDKHEDFKTEKETNYTYTIVNLVSNILMIVISIICLYLGVTAESICKEVTDNRMFK